MKYDLLRAVNNGVNIQEMDLRVVDYARVSTASREQRKSFENQLDNDITFHMPDHLPHIM